MASSSQSNHHSELAKIEQIITKFFAKSLQIILDSRSPCVSSRNYRGEQTQSSLSSVRPRDKWFNLILRECPAASENIHLWRQSNDEPMIVDVILVQRPVDLDPVRCSSGVLVRNLSMEERFPNCWNSGKNENGKIIERWVFQYENWKSRDSSSRSKRCGGTDSCSLYKKSIILLRSLYQTVRMLPAYKLFRDINSSRQICTFYLAHRVSSVFEPFTHREEGEMQQFGFTPVDTSCCRLQLSVLYRPTLLDVSLEPLIPSSPQFIPDYVGSPTSNPLKRFSSFPVSRLVSRGSENCPSPLFSPSPSPSPPPPTCFPGNHLSKTLSRSESAPGSIPTAKLGRIPLVSNNNVLPLSPHIGTMPGGSSQNEKVTALNQFRDIQIDVTTQKMNSCGKNEVGNLSGAKISTNSSPRISLSRCFGRLPFQEFNDSKIVCPFVVDYDDIWDQQTRPQSSDEKGHLSKPLEPGGLLPLRQSHGAAVGALVHMLKTAPPLRQDVTNSNKSPKIFKPEIWNKSTQELDESSTSEPVAVQIPVSDVGMKPSGFLTSKTTAEALEELWSYRETKDLLLRQGSGSQPLANVAHAIETED